MVGPRPATPDAASRVVVAKGSRASLPTSAGLAGQGQRQRWGGAAAAAPPRRHRALEYLARVRGQLRARHLEARLDLVRARRARAARLDPVTVTSSRILLRLARPAVAQLAVGTTIGWCATTC